MEAERERKSSIEEDPAKEDHMSDTMGLLNSPVRMETEMRGDLSLALWDRTALCTSSVRVPLFLIDPRIRNDNISVVYSTEMKNKRIKKMPRGKS